MACVTVLVESDVGLDTGTTSCIILHPSLEIYFIDKVYPRKDVIVYMKSSQSRSEVSRLVCHWDCEYVTAVIEVAACPVPIG